MMTGLKIAAAALALSMLVAFPAQAEKDPTSNWMVDHGNSKITFHIDHAGQKFDGHFKTFGAEILFDPNDLANARVTASVDLLSADTGYQDRDQMLPMPEWFNAHTYRHAVFSSTSIRKGDAPNAYVADGALSMKNVSKPFSLPFTLDISDDGKNAHMKSAFELNRTDFKIGTGEWGGTDTVPHMIPVRIDLKAKHVNP